MKARGLKMWWFLGQVLALAVVLQSAPRADEASCVSAARQANLHCWELCGADDDGCVANCDATFEVAGKRCKSATTGNAAANTLLYGTKKGGQDGCYFGECPGDLKDRIKDTEGEQQPEAVEPAPPRKRRQPPVQVSEEPGPAPIFPVQAVQMTTICQTPYFWCVMYQPGPVNSPCWCTSTYGVANGVTVPQQ